MDFELVPIQPDIDITGFHSIYYFEFDKNFYHPPERHDFWEMVYVDDGCINAIVDGIGCTLSQGQVIFHQPMEMHSHIANQQEASNVVVVSFACRSPLMARFNKKIFQLEKPSQKVLSLFLAEAEGALGQLPGDFENKSPLDFSHARPGSMQLMQCYLVEFLFSLLRAGESSVRFMQPFLNEAFDGVSQRTFRHAAGCLHFSISRTYLCRIFKEATGTSPVDYWIGLKIKEAKKLIREGERNMTQISELLGYSSIHHFTRMFKRMTGLSPTAYKNSIIR